MDTKLFNIIRTSALRLLALRGLRTLCVRRVAFLFNLYKYCKQKLTNNFSYGSENMILHP